MYPTVWKYIWLRGDFFRVGNGNLSICLEALKDLPKVRPFASLRVGFDKCISENHESAIAVTILAAGTKIFVDHNAYSHSFHLILVTSIRICLRVHYTRKLLNRFILDTKTLTLMMRFSFGNASTSAHRHDTSVRAQANMEHIPLAHTKVSLMQQPCNLQVISGCFRPIFQSKWCKDNSVAICHWINQKCVGCRWSERQLHSTSAGNHCSMIQRFHREGLQIISCT